MSTEPLTDAEIDTLITESRADSGVRLESASSIKVYRNAIDYLYMWHSLRYGVPLGLPTPVPVVLQYIVDHSQPLKPEEPGTGLPEAIDEALVASGLKKSKGLPRFSTMKMRLSALGGLHRVRNHVNPCADPVVARLLARIARDRAPTRPAVTMEPLQAMLATCDDSMIGLRDRALLWFAWSCGGTLPSEVAEVQLCDVYRTTSGSYLFRRAAQAADDERIEIKGSAAAALDAWIGAAGIMDGYLFRGAKHKTALGRGLAAQRVAEIVKVRAALAGLSNRISSRSLRLGFVAESMEQGAPIADVTRKVAVRDVVRVMSDAARAEDWSVGEGTWR